MMKLWVDDEREVPDDTWTRAYSLYEARCLLLSKHWNVVSLDHDLGKGGETRALVLMWCEMPHLWPDEVLVHSSNPPGSKWLRSMIDRYHPNGKDYRPY